jgi:hypothetical protein
MLGFICQGCADTPRGANFLNLNVSDKRHPAEYTPTACARNHNFARRPSSEWHSGDGGNLASS